MTPPTVTIIDATYQPSTVLSSAYHSIIPRKVKLFCEYCGHRLHCCTCPHTKANKPVVISELLLHTKTKKMIGMVRYTEKFDKNGRGYGEHAGMIDRRTEERGGQEISFGFAGYVMGFGGSVHAMKGKPEDWKKK